jgi:hypothetical protein
MRITSLPNALKEKIAADIKAVSGDPTIAITSPTL